MNPPESPLSSPGTGLADQAVDVRRYFDALRRGAPLIAVIAVVATVVVFLFTHTLPKAYKASSNIVYNPAATLLQSSEATSTQRQLATFQSLIQTQPVMASAAAKLSESPVTLKSAISSSGDPNANLITITATAGKAVLAAARANAVAKAFLAEEQTRQNVGLQTARAQLQAEVAQLQGTPGGASQIRALQERISALQINAAGTASELQIAESAIPPGGPYSPRPTLDAILALFVSILVGILFVLGRDQLRPRFGTPRELGRALDLPVLAGIPYRRQRATPRRLRALSGLEHEAYDALQATVRLLSARDESQRVLLITSATHGEGKTTVTASLGRSLARVGQRTLLISGDMRSPTLHTHFGMPAAPGLADCLVAIESGTREPRDAVEAMIRTAPDETNLDVLPGGHIPSDPNSLMSGTALGLVFEAVRQMDYSYVLLDSPPVLGLGDSQLLARQIDDVLLVARLDRVDPSQVEDLNELFERLQLTPIGLVAVGARVEISPYYLSERPVNARL